VQPYAVDIDELAACRHLLFHLTRSPCGEENERKQGKGDERGSECENPGNGGHLSTPAPFGVIVTATRGAVSGNK
jgi:hypothetical protein